jgi:hypothetical protein
LYIFVKTIFYITNKCGLQNYLFKFGECADVGGWQRIVRIFLYCDGSFQRQQELPVPMFSWAALFNSSKLLCIEYPLESEGSHMITD